MSASGDSRAILDLHAQGWTAQEIADSYHVSQLTTIEDVHRVLHRAGRTKKSKSLDEMIHDSR